MLDIKLEQQYIIDLVSYTLFDTPFDFNKYENKELDYKYIATKIHEQKMEGLVYHAMSTLKINNNLYNHLHNRYMTILYTCVQQENEYQELVKLFEANNIDYVPLKGTFMKHYYPKMEMRLMGNIDVLIPNEKQIEVRELLLKNGYKLSKDLDCSKHHEVFQYKHTTFEIHYRLLDKISTKRDYLDNNVWLETTNHSFTPEFNITYQLAHYANHFSHEGASYKSMIDIALLLKKERINYEKLKEILIKTGYYAFFNNVVQVFNRVFNQNVFCFEQKLNEEEIIRLNEYLFKCGDFGFGFENDQDQIKVINDFSSKKINAFTKFGYLIKRVCLPYKEFKKQSKLIKYCPILLPFGWVIRFFVLIFDKKRNAKKKISQVKNINYNEINEYDFSVNLLNKFLNE